MKTNFKSILSAASIVMLLASCAKEMTPSTGDGSALVFSATTAATKTTIEKGTGNERIVKWAAGDEVSIWWDGGSTDSYAAGAGTTTTFSFVGAEGEATYYAAYPGSAATAFAGDSLTISVSNKQDGAFASANIAVATSTSAAKNFPFYNASALVKFNVGSAEYTKAVFRGANGENLTGSYAVKFAGAGITVGDVTSAGTSVEIDLNGAGTYYFSVLPDVTLPDGFSISLYKDGEAVPAASLAKNLELNRSVITDLGNIDGRVRSDYFVTVAGAGKKNGSSWENALGVAELREMIKQPVKEDGGQDDGQAHYKASLLDGVTFHMAAGDYAIAGDSTHVKIEFSAYANPVKMTFKGGYPKTLTGISTEGRSADNVTAFTGNKQGGIFTFGNQTDLDFDTINFKDVTTSEDNRLAAYIAAGESGSCTVDFKSCKFQNNIQTDKGKTGAAVTIHKADVTFSSCYFSSNQARNGSSVNAGPGSNVTIDDSQFVGNTTWNTSGALQNGGGTMVVNRCTFNGNESGCDSTMYSAGGAFHTNGDGAVTTFNTCSFTNNTSKMGGAVSVQNATVTFNECSFTENSAYRNEGYTSTSATDKRAGGAIFIANNNAVVNLNDCYFGSNTAPYGSGGAIAITGVKTLSINAGTTFRGNSCYYEGGAIYAQKGLTITGTDAKPVLFESNKTTHAGNQVGNGGALWMDESTTSTLAYARFVNNCAGVGNNFSNGGGVYMRGVTKFVANNCYFSGNLGRNGGAANLQLGGSSDCQFNSCTFEKNYMNDKNANFGSATLGSCNFHGTVCVGYGTAKFSKCTFNDNISNNGSGVFHINNNGATVDCRQCTFTKNQAPNGNGGAVTVEKGKFTAVDCVFDGNQVGTSRYGGFMRIDANSTTVELVGCTIKNNYAPQGGAINANGKGLLKIKDCLFTGNKSDSRGSCLQTNTGHVIYVNNTTFYSNTTTGSNASWGVVTHGNATLCMNNVTIYGNKNTNATQTNVATLNGDNSMLLVNSTVIGDDNLSLIRANATGHYISLCNNVLINTRAGKEMFTLNAGVTLTAKNNLMSTTATAVDTTNVIGLTEASLTNGQYVPASETVARGYYMWSGAVTGFTAATSAEVEAVIKGFARKEDFTGTTAIGSLFYSWLTGQTPNALSVDGRGVARTGTMWPGAYQNN